MPSGFVGSQHNYNFSQGKEVVRTITQNYCILNGQQINNTRYKPHTHTYKTTLRFCWVSTQLQLFTRK